jgi:hypothetical protein
MDFHGGFPSRSARGAGLRSMKLLTVLAATAVAAFVAAALSIPAGADQSAGSKAAKPAAPTDLVTCLRTHGLNPPSDLFALKPWMVRQSGTSTGKAALAACHVSFDAPRNTVTAQQFGTCLRAHGAGVPSGAGGLALKTWIGEHQGSATVMRALKQCDSGPDPGPVKAAGCGGAAAPPQPPATPRASSRPRAARPL